MRDDIGKLWENFLFIARIKVNHYNGRAANIYFWRTYDQKEIDLIEEREGRLFGYEVKWKGEIKQSNKDELLEIYENSEVQTVNKDNFETFLEIKG